MSYQKIKSFTFDKDFLGLRCETACNNIRPLMYGTFKERKDDHPKTAEMSPVEYVAHYVQGFVWGELQFNNKSNLIQYTIDKTLQEFGFKDGEDTWNSVHDFASWDHETQSFKDNADRVKYEEKEKRFQDFLTATAQYIISGFYKEQFTETKKEVFVLTDGFSFISKLNDSKFTYGTINAAKRFNGLQKTQFQGHFSITKYGYYFQKV